MTARLLSEYAWRAADRARIFGVAMQSRMIALALFVLSVAPVRAQPGVGLTADPNIPIPLYHPRGDFTTKVDKLLAAKPVVAAISVPLGVLPAAIAMLPFSDALYPRESNGALMRIVYYGRLLEGFARSSQVRKGMTFQQVREIMGWNDGGTVGGLNGFTDIHHSLGVLVDWPLMFDTGTTSRVERVRWQFRWYTPVAKPIP